jgi:tape measure domain-containing protein
LYAENANQARNLERQLRELGDSYRHVADMATQAATAQASEATARVTANYMNRGMVRAQEQALAELGQRVRAGVAATPLALPAAGQTTAPGTGLEISGGARVGRATGRIQRFFSGFEVGEAQIRLPGQPQGYGPQATEEQADRARRAAVTEADAVRTSAEARARAEQQIQSYRAEIAKARSADIGSIESTERLRGAINQYRSTLPGASAEFRKLTKELGDLDVRSEKLSRSLGRRRMTGMQMTQAAGAALSGGIFGGPEGFLGGAIGSAFGVGGAFAGAAIGAQVGGLRQQLGGFADYAAQIQKMQIALKGAAGTQEEFNRAVAAAESATRNLNVPQDVAIQGMTQLTAAVKGAGGQVSDAELVFRNVSSAIKATGGSAQDVDGAITAMVQVFSKGKVSAEELSGQLGERLPGAVTKFAKANNMTLPELQKALEQGQVGLNELMNFIIQLGGEYSGVAQKIAASSQDAGARLTVAFNEMKIAVGEALQPIGAQFQEAFIPFIENITPALVNLLPKIGDFALSVAKNLDVLAAAAGGAALAMGALSIASIKVAGTAGLSLLGVAMMKAASAAGALTVALKASSVAALLNPWVALAAGIAAATVALIKHNQAQQEYNNLLDNGAGSTDELRLKQRELESEITAARKALEGSADGMGATGRQAMQLKMKIAELENQLARINKTFTVRLKLEREGFTFDEKGKTETFTVAGIVYDANGVPIRRADGSPLNGLTDFSSPTSDKAGAGKTKKERESQLPQLMAELAVQQQIAQINEKIRNAQLAENQFLQIRLEGERELAQIAGDIQKIALEKIPADEAKIKRELLMIRANEARKNTELRLQQAEKQNLVEITQQSDDLAKSYTTQLEDRQRLQELVATGMKEALALEYIQIENMLKVEKERLETRRALLLEAGKPEEAQGTQDLIDRLGSKETGLKGLAAAAQPEEKGKLQQFIEQAEAELKDLEALAVRISQNIGNAVGNSIANGITGLIEGTTTAKEIFANFLKDVGQILIQEGAKMIATYIAIGIAKAFAGLASGGGGGGEVPGALGEATNTGLDTGAGNISDMLSGLAAKGAYFSGGQADFAQNSIQPFATGGIVTRPTFFKYAKGGEMQNGLMGEAGPEAIMPLKRGADGKLGVAAKLDGAMGRYRRSPGSVGGAAGGGTDSESGAGSAAMQPIDVRYSVERINSVDYVTADQFQAGMQQAAAQGARQGEQRALNSLRQNTTTRRKVGI